jgi:hypothetical protein
MISQARLRIRHRGPGRYVSRIDSVVGCLELALYGYCNGWKVLTNTHQQQMCGDAITRRLPLKTKHSTDADV